MKFYWRLIVTGIGCFIVFLVVTLPADVVLPRLRARGIVANGISGTIWHGRAATLQIGRAAFGGVEWNVRAWRILAGKLSVDFEARDEVARMRGMISTGLGKRVSIRGLQGSIPVSSLGGFGLPGGWQGSTQLELSAVELENNWPVVVSGSVRAVDLVGPANQPMQIGSFRVDFTPGDQSKGVDGKLSSIGEGPFDVTGTLRLLPNRTYVIDAQVGTKPRAPAQITNGLQYLGPPDAQGRRPLSLSGSL